MIGLSKAIGISILSNICVGSVKVPKSEIAEGGPHDIVDFREHFELFGGEGIVRLIFSVHSCIVLFG